MADDARFSDLLKNTPGGCLIVEEGVVLGANLDSVSITGIPRTHLVGAPLGELVVPEDTASINQAIHEAGPGLSVRSARLNHAFKPIEFSFRRLSERLVAVGIRSMDVEHQYSALASGAHRLADRHLVVAVFAVDEIDQDQAVVHADSSQREHAEDAHQAERQSHNCVADDRTEEHERDE